MMFNKNNIIIYSGGDNFIDSHIDIIQYNDANQAKAHIEDYFKNYGGFCKTVENIDNNKLR